MTNVLNILKALNQGENYLVQIPNYERIGNAIKDNFDLFERKEIPVPTPFELVGNENRLNLSVENKIYGEVKLNPKQAKRVGLPNVITGPMIYRRKTIIKDNTLNVKEMELIIDMKTYMFFKNEGLNFKQLENNTSYPGYYVILNLSNMDIADSKMDYTLDEILNNVTYINQLKAKQKVLKALIKELPEEQKESVMFTEEQLEMLKDHGLDETLQYIGVDNEIKETEEKYEGEIIEFKVKGSSMNTFSNVLKRIKEGLKLNPMDTIQYEFYDELKNNLNIMNMTEIEDIRNYYKGELKKIKFQLFNIKLRNVIIKLTFVNSPLKEVAVDAKNNYKGLNINIKNMEFTR